MPATLFDIQRKYGESVYPLYKDQMHEPYMENGKGGFQGVVLYDELEDKVRCEECGKWYGNMSTHLKSHKLSTSEYKEKQGLLRRTPLCSKKMSEGISKSNRKRNDAMGKTGVWEKMRAISKLPRTHKVHKLNNLGKKFTNISQHKNKFGACDAQISARMIICAKMSNKDVLNLTHADIMRTDSSLMGIVSGQYGNWKLATKALGISAPVLGGERYEDAELVAILRNWTIKNKRLPMYRDFVKKGISSLALASAGVIYKHFGSWRRAKMMAGLELLLKEIGGELPKTDEERKKELIDSLKNYVVKNKKIPMSKPGAKQKELHLPYGVGVYKKLFGSWTNAKKEAQLDSLLKEIGGKLPEEEKRINLIDSLREYVMKNKKIPLAKDKKTDTGLSFSIRTYKNHFGSWNRAKMMAGLDQLLAEIKVKESELVKKEK